MHSGFYCCIYVLTVKFCIHIYLFPASTESLNNTNFIAQMKNFMISKSTKKTMGYKQIVIITYVVITKFYCNNQ